MFMKQHIKPSFYDVAHHTASVARGCFVFVQIFLVLHTRWKLVRSSQKNLLGQLQHPLRDGFIKHVSCFTVNVIINVLLYFSFTQKKKTVKYLTLRQMS